MVARAVINEWFDKNLGIGKRNTNSYIYLGECTGGQFKTWTYPSSLLQPITPKHIKQQQII